MTIMEFTGSYACTICILQLYMQGSLWVGVFQIERTQVLQVFLQSLKDRAPGTVVNVLMTDDGI